MFFCKQPAVPLRGTLSMEGGGGGGGVKNANVVKRIVFYHVKFLNILCKV